MDYAKVKIRTCVAISGAYLEKEINFSVDWSNRTLSGTLKDTVHKIRSFKGFKI